MRPLLLLCFMVTTASILSAQNGAPQPVEVVTGVDTPSANVFLDLDEAPRPSNMSEAAPSYPRYAVDNGIYGKVLIRVLVSTAGSPLKVQVMRSPHPVLTDAVLAKVNQLKFTPAMKDGKPVMAWVTIPFDFKQPPQPNKK